MLKTPRSARGMVTSPHHLASQSGLDRLKAGGSAVEAVVAAAATLAVVYPHMCGLGGDGFWLISEPGKDPISLCAAGRTGAGVNQDLYARAGYAAIPTRGPLAANTVAGVVDGWRVALDVSEGWGRKPNLQTLFHDAIGYANAGAFVSQSQAQLTRDGYGELIDVPGFATFFLKDGHCPIEGDRLANPMLARTFQRLADDGLDSFYRGGLAADIASDLSRLGCPITAEDLSAHRSTVERPYSVSVPGARIYNLPPPTQGVISLMILGLLARLDVARANEFEHLHAAVEATKMAFLDRNRYLGDPAFMEIDASKLVDSTYLDDLAKRIDLSQASPWASERAGGDTVWLAAIDAEGRAVSYIQSIYFDFGSGVVLPETGILWQNRGISFSLETEGVRSLAPNKLPFHTLCPAFAEFDDGRRMVFGAMGGDGQPQSHSALFPRYAYRGFGLQEAVTAPRWLLGRRWGDEGASLKLESRIEPEVIGQLRAAGHDIEIVDAFCDLMGHAGAIVRHADGSLEGASDPRSDGLVAGW